MSKLNNMKLTRTLATLSIATLALVGCSAEDMEAYKAEQEATTATDADVELVEVPDLAGMNLKEAKKVLKDLDLDVDEYDVSEDNKSVYRDKNWEVTEQDPTAGEQVEPDTEILLGVQKIEDEDDAENEEETSEDDAEATQLAEDLEAALLESNAVDSFQALEPTSPGYYINGIEGITSSSARVIIQAELTEDETDQTARWVFNHGCTGVDLDTVVIQDTTGIDQNFYAEHMDPPVLCD